jgi:hypothetical protein
MRCAIQYIFEQLLKRLHLGLSEQDSRFRIRSVEHAPHPSQVFRSLPDCGREGWVSEMTHRGRTVR